MSVAEIARLAGVSRGTVYRVLKNDPIITPETAGRIKDAMEHVGYTPKVPLKGDKGGNGQCCGTIALLFVGSRSYVNQCPFITATLHGAERALSSDDVNMIFATISDSAWLPPGIREGKVDGIILSANYLIPKDLTPQLRRFPIVWMQVAPFDWGDEVTINHERTGQLAAEYLLEKGHSHVAFLNPVPCYPSSVIRGKVFQSHMENAGGKVEMLLDDSTLSQMPREHEDYLKLVPGLVDRFFELSPRPQGLFLPSDKVTVALYQDLHRRGVSPNEDVTIISCNNEKSLLAGLFPRPATIDTFPENIGECAVDLLLWRIQNPSKPRIRVTLEPRLLL